MDRKKRALTPRQIEERIRKIKRLTFFASIIVAAGSAMWILQAALSDPYWDPKDSPEVLIGAMAAAAAVAFLFVWLVYFMLRCIFSGH